MRAWRVGSVGVRACSRARIRLDVGLGMAFTIAGLAVLVTLNWSVLGPVPGEHPFTLDASAWNFGEVRWDDHPAHTFHLRNNTRRLLAVNRVEASCGCTAAKVTPRRVPPGENAALNVSFLPYGYNGAVERTVSLWVAGCPRSLVLTIRANVNALLTPEPVLVDFGRISPRSHVCKTVVLKDTSREGAGITRVEASSQWLRVRLLPRTSRASRSRLVSVSLSDPPTGRFYERLRVRTSLRSRPELEIPVKADVVGNWPLSDPEFFFGFVSKRSQPSSRVTIEGLPPARIARVRVDSPGGSVRVSPDPSGSSSVLTTTLDLRRAPIGELRGAVVVNVRGPTEPLLRIPLVGSVLEASDVGDCCSHPK